MLLKPNDSLCNTTCHYRQKKNKSCFLQAGINNGRYIQMHNPKTAFSKGVRLFSKGGVYRSFLLPASFH